MPVQIRSTSTQPNQTATFDFTGYNVLSFVTGIAYWDFHFHGDDHQVKTLALSLVNNQPDSHTVNVNVSGTFSDDSGNNIDNPDSSVVLCCVAVVDSPDSSLTLAGASSIPNGGASAPIALPGSSLAISSAFLSGFDLSYGDTDHHVLRFQTAAGFAANGSQGEITAQAAMSDNSGDDASTTTINGGLIAATPNESGLLVESRANLQTHDDVVVEFGTEISNAVPLLQSLDVQFDSGHCVQAIGGGCTSWYVSGTSVTLYGALAFMHDISGNNQDDSASSVSMLVVAIPR
ncbi:MAG: hypothetical protein QOH06_5569 [Acidobacteriota bacterium]|nr:hypothetical protein [Acidobacteriota bacterium]